ncbi:ABC transporter ATP-binding protein [Actinomycetaceae bacterium L2_0104]
MGTPRAADPAELGRGRLTRWLPVLWQAPPAPPAAVLFGVDATTTPVRFLMRVLFSARRYTIPAAVLGILWQVGEALVPVVMGLAIDRALATGDTGQLLLWLAVLAGVFLMLSLAFRFAAQLVARATQLVQHRLRATLSRSVLHADGAGARQPGGGVVSMMTNDVTRVASMGLTVYPVAEFAGIVFIAVSLLAIYWPLGIAVLAGAPASVWVMGLLSGKLARNSRVYQTLLADTVGRATDLVAGYRVIKGVRAEGEAARRYRDASQQTLAGAYRNVALLGRFLAGSNTVSGVFVAAVAALAGWFTLTGELSIGELIAAVGLAQALLPPMRMLAMNAVPTWASAIASAGRVLDALKAAPAQSSPGEPAPPTGATSPGDPTPNPPAIELSLGTTETVRIEPGEFVGLRMDERTGADAVDALLNPSTREATRIGVQIEDGANDTFSYASYRSQVTVSPHHATLFSGTVTDNLDLPGSRPEMWKEALRVAACDDFVSASGGLDENVGEMGNRLSGGQRQRLALARALVRDTPVLVLHDPTTAVDSVTEQTISSRLRAIRANRSTLIITSSPALLSACDRVVSLGAMNPGHGDEDRGDAHLDDDGEGVTA